jgi:Elongation factor TS
LLGLLARPQIVAGRVAKTVKTMALLEQPFIKDTDKTVAEVVKETVAAIGENIQIRRFTRCACVHGIVCVFGGGGAFFWGEGGSCPRGCIRLALRCKLARNSACGGANIFLSVAVGATLMDSVVDCLLFYSSLDVNGVWISPDE